MKKLLFVCLSLLLVSCVPDETKKETGTGGPREKLDEKATSLYQRGRYSEGAKVAEEALSVAEKKFGPNHPNVATSLNNLAELYYAQGKYAEVEVLYKRSLAIAEKALGKDHPNVADPLFKLANLYQFQGKYAEVEPLYKRSLAITEKVLGKDHPGVALSLNNLAGLYRNQGKYAEAEPLYERSLAIGEKALGKDHPAVAQSLNNLAGLFQSQGKYAEAEPLYERLLAIWEKALGKDHPNVARSLNNLAGLFQAQGKYAEAEPLYERSLAIREKALYKYPPAVAQSLNNLAGLFQSQGKYAEAEPLYERSLAIREKALGKNHPAVAIALGNLVELYRSQGKYAEAKPLCKRSLAILERTLPTMETIRSENRSRLSLLSFGMSKEEALGLMGTETKETVQGWRVPNPIRTETYKTGEHVYELLLYYTGATRADFTITDDELTPIVILDGKLDGLSWSYWQDKTRQYELPIRYKDIKTWNAVSSATMAAQNHRQFGRYRETIEPLRRAVAQNPEVIEPYIELACSYLLLWETQQSEDDRALERALEMSRKSVALYDSSVLGNWALSHSLLWSKQHELSIAMAEKVISITQRAPIWHAVLGYAHNFVGKPESAVALAETTKQSDPDNIGCLGVLAHAYRLLGRHGEAIATDKRIIGMNPPHLDTFRAHLNLAISYADLGRAKEAATEAAEVLKLVPNFSVDVYGERIPYKDLAQAERDMAALRKAGLK